MSAAQPLAHGLPAHAVEALRAVFADWPAVEAAILYGSRAKGSHRAGSDIDLTLVGGPLTIADLLAIENRIDDLLLPWTVDLSLRADIENQDLLAHIDRVGVPLYQRAPPARVKAPLPPGEGLG